MPAAPWASLLGETAANDDHDGLRTNTTSPPDFRRMPAADSDLHAEHGDLRPAPDITALARAPYLAGVESDDRAVDGQWAATT